MKTTTQSYRLKNIISLINVGDKKMAKKFFLYTNWTCIRRKLDTQKIANYLKANKQEIVDDPRKADVIIYVTCSTFNKRTEQAIQQIQELKKYDAELIVAGCVPGMDPERLSEVFDGTTLVTKEIEKIDDIFPEHKVKFKDIPDTNIPWENKNKDKPLDAMKDMLCQSQLIENSYKQIFNALRETPLLNTAPVNWYGSAEDDLYYVRPARGCLGKCSYCAIWKAIGKLQSKPMEVCIEEMKKGIAEGHKTIIIDADDIGGYGTDIGTTFTELLRQLTSIPGDYHVDVHYIHPKWLVKYIDELEEIVKEGKIRRILSAIQSGNERILGLMNRYKNVEKIQDAFQRLQAANPHLLLETECICGFPSETKEEFQDTLDFIVNQKVRWGVIFPFSCKTGSKAETIDPKIPDEEIMARIHEGKKYLKEAGYDVRYAKFFKKRSQNIIVFSDTEFMTKFRKKYSPRGKKTEDNQQ